MQKFFLQVGMIVVLFNCFATLLAEEKKAVDGDIRRVRIVYLVSVD
ncbi:hypothetical protein ACFL3Q_09505 [Planctomycetota bacterium]